MIFEKNKDIYEQYVCPHCFYTLDKCTCSAFPQYSILWVDKGIQEHVRIMNSKGYVTRYSCESHDKNDTINISFYNDIGIEKTVQLPEGFTKSKGCIGIEYKYPSNITDEQFEKLKEKQLGILLDWCESLPDGHQYKPYI